MSDYKVKAGKSVVIGKKVYTESDELPKDFNGANCSKSCEIKKSEATENDKKKIEDDKKALKEKAGKKSDVKGVGATAK